MEEEIVKRFEKLEARVAGLETERSRDTVSDQTTSSSGKKLSIKEFILSKNPKSDRQRTRAIGYFLEKHGEYVSFTNDDIEKGYKDAKEAVPTNVADTISKNVSQGYMMQAEKKNGKMSWTLTNTGEKNVEAGFAKGD